jgi:hypothetical protein
MTSRRQTVAVSRSSPVSWLGTYGENANSRRFLLGASYIWLVVLFGSDYSIERASLIPVEVAREAATDDLHVRGNRIMAVDVFLDGRDVQDITELVAAALDELDSEFV